MFVFDQLFQCWKTHLDWPFPQGEELNQEEEVETGGGSIKFIIMPQSQPTQSRSLKCAADTI